MAKSQNSSQMNLSGSSSSLTSDASTKAGTISLRSYGIGGALLHKRILMMTRQQSQESSRDREAEPQEKRIKLEMVHEETEQRRGRPEKQNNQCAQTEAEMMSMRFKAGGPETHTGRSMVHVHNPTLSPVSIPQIMRPRPPESPIRKRLMSPFRILKGRSASRERPCVNREEEAGEIMPSSPQDETGGQAEHRARRSVSPNPFLWLCRDKQRRKTV